MSNWASVVPSAGTLNEIVSAIFQENTGDIRQVTITCKTSNGGTSSIIFTQEKCIFIVNPLKKTTTSAATTFNISVTANKSYTLSSNVNWISLSATAGTSGLSTFTATIGENDDEAARYGNITIGHITVPVTQLYYAYSIPFTYDSSKTQYVNTADSWGAEILQVKMNKGNGEIIFAEAPTIIPLYAFNRYGGQGNLYTVTLPESITEIGALAFYKNSGITSIELPKNLIKIGGDSFKGTSLTSVIIPDSTIQVDSAFVSCRNLTNVHIGTGVIKCAGAFEFCTSLPIIDGIRYADTCACFATDYTMTGCTIKEGTKYIGNGGSHSMSQSSEGSTFEYCTLLSSITLPNSLIEIGDCAFFGCKGLTGITIPSSVKYIGGAAFRGCNNIQSIVLPTGITNIEGSTFVSCWALSSINIPNGVTSINYGAFDACGALNNITFPVSLTNIAYTAFNNCISLNTINYAGTMAQWANVTLEDGWKANVPATVCHCSDGDVAI